MSILAIKHHQDQSFTNKKFADKYKFSEDFVNNLNKMFLKMIKNKTNISEKTMLQKKIQMFEVVGIKSNKIDGSLSGLNTAASNDTKINSKTRNSKGNCLIEENGSTLSFEFNSKCYINTQNWGQ